MHVFARWQHMELDLDAGQRTVQHWQFDCTWLRHHNDGRATRSLLLADKQELRQGVEHQLRRSRDLPNRRCDLLLNEQTTFQIEAAPFGRLLFCLAPARARGRFSPHLRAASIPASGRSSLSAASVEGAVKRHEAGRVAGPRGDPLRGDPQTPGVGARRGEGNACLQMSVSGRVKVQAGEGCGRALPGLSLGHDPGPHERPPCRRKAPRARPPAPRS